MRNNWVGLFLILVVFGGFSSVSASPPVASEYKLQNPYVSFAFTHLSASNVWFCFNFQFCLHFHILLFAEIVSGIVSNVASALVKWLWSLKSTTNIGTYHLLISHLDFSLFFLWLFIPYRLDIALCNFVVNGFDGI